MLGTAVGSTLRRCREESLPAGLNAAGSRCPSLTERRIRHADHLCCYGAPLSRNAVDGTRPTAPPPTLTAWATRQSPPHDGVNGMGDLPVAPTLRHERHGRPRRAAPTFAPQAPTPAAAASHPWRHADRCYSDERLDLRDSLNHVAHLVPVVSHSGAVSFDTRSRIRSFSAASVTTSTRQRSRSSNAT